MALYLLKLLRSGMAHEAIGIGITPTVLDGLLPRPCHLEQPVSEAVAFRGERTVYSIRGVARVALVVGDPLVSIVPGR